jgi:uncharacterized protein YbaP (TraB family)
MSPRRPLIPPGVGLAGMLLCILVATAANGASLPTVKVAETTGRPAAPPGIRVGKFSKGLLWKIETDGVAPSFLFGTIHTSDPRVLAAAQPAQRVLLEASSFTMETFFNGSGLVRMAEHMFFDGDENLEDLLGKEYFALAQQALRERGLPTLNLHRKKPWVVVLSLSSPPPHDLLFLDLRLQLDAVRAGKPNHRLETMEEQLAVFTDMPLADQIVLLKETLRAHRQTRRQMEELIQAYLTRDLEKLMNIVHKYKPQDDRIYRSMMDRLISRRNVRMAERLAPRLREGNAFIAVGAGHLPGETGLLNLLEKSGYRVTPVY